MAITARIPTDFARHLTDWGEAVTYTAEGGSTTAITAIWTEVSGQRDASVPTGIDDVHVVEIKLLNSALAATAIQARGKFTRASDSSVCVPIAAPVNVYGVIAVRCRHTVRQKFGRG